MARITFKKILIIAIILITAFYLGKTITPKRQSVSFSQTKEPDKITINNYTFTIEVADNDELRGKGLSDRDSLADDHGMLFIFPKEAFYNIWMYKMKFPLDIIWIKDDKIVDITEKVPIPDTEDITKLPLYQSKAAVDKVLEVNVGKVKQLNIKIGDKIKLNY